MNIEQLWLVLPTDADLVTAALTVHQWTSVLEQFKAQGGREVMLGGPEPLGFPGFWHIVRRAAALRIPRVSAYLKGNLLEPWVVRELVERNVHLLVPMDSLQAQTHEALHGAGSHSRATAAVNLFLDQGLAARVGILATATRLNQEELPSLLPWAAERRLARVLWATVPEGEWPSEQLRSLRLSPEEKAAVAGQIWAARREAPGCFVGPLDAADAPDCGYARLLRIEARGDCYWGFSDQRLGNLKRAQIKELLERNAQAAG